MSKYIYDENGNCVNDDSMYFKANGIVASYGIAKNKHGYARTFQTTGSNITICRPISWEYEDISNTKNEAITLVKSELKQALITANYNGQFDGILLAMGEIELPVKQEIKEVITKQQLELF